jgi:YidC/Oxa1 family membrane protein insertase
MQKLAPLQKKIQAAFPNPEQEQQKAQSLTQLYAAAEVNPLAGCLPAFIQIPVFISLYRALTNLVAEDSLREGFLWLPSLEGPIYGKPSSDWFSSIFTGNPSLGWEETKAYLTLPLILIVTQSASSRLLTPPRPPGSVMTPQEQSSQSIVNFLPFLIASFSINVPAGLSVYWIASNVLTTIITLAVRAGIQVNDFPPEVQQMMASIEGGPEIALAGDMDAGFELGQEALAPSVKKGSKFRELMAQEGRSEKGSKFRELMAQEGRSASKEDSVE